MIRAAVLLILLATPVAAATCTDIEYLGTSFTVCEVDPATEDLRLFLNGPDGAPLREFSAVEDMIGGELAIAMNGGMYHPDRRPVGLYMEGGQVVQEVIRSAGPGNFGMLPNGVICIEEDRARVIETERFVATGPNCRDASQSGPMLVIDGQLHPRFIPGGTSRKIRNGVGSTSDGDRLVFAISNERVNFHDFGTLFRDRLGLPNALYIDGRVSRLHAPGIGRSDGGPPMGPIIGVVAP